MLIRRTLLLSAAAALPVTGLPLSSARAQHTDQASAFIQQTGRDLTDAVNGPGTITDKQRRLQGIIDRAVDVNEVARFCLGRFWRTASPPQQTEYLELFHRVLMLSITGKIGEYQGVRIDLGRAQLREGGEVLVSSTVIRPGNPPAKVDWLVSMDRGNPKIVDLIAEGTSLRLTQRNDYSAYLAHNNNSVQALIDALRQQANQPG